MMADVDPNFEPDPADASQWGGRGRGKANAFVWPTPLDFLANPHGEAPELLPEHIPPAINDFVFDTATRMGVDPTSVAVASIVSCASVQKTPASGVRSLAIRRF
jgi:hypothetical protein